MIIRSKGVIDINNDTPLIDDCFLIDTNVLLWLTYNRLSLLESKYQEYQIDSYPIFLEKAIEVGSQLKYSRLSFGEISHVIERCEHEIYCMNNSSTINMKSYRRNFPTERNGVITAIKDSFIIIKGVSTGIVEELDDTMLTLLEDDLHNSLLDGNDSFLASFAKRNDINKIISDDADFATIEDVYLFTSNKKVLSEARRQNKYINRLYT